MDKKKKTCYRGKPRFYVSVYKFLINHGGIVAVGNSFSNCTHLFKRLAGIIRRCTATKHWKQTFHA